MTTKAKREGREKYLIIRVDPETHRALKLRAVVEGTSVQRLVAGAIAKHLPTPKRTRPAKAAP